MARIEKCRSTISKMAQGVQISSFVFSGTAILNEVFGFFRASAACQIQRLQLSAQQAPTGGSVTIQLIDSTGAAVGSSVSLGNTQTSVDYQMPATVTLRASQSVRAKITAVDVGGTGGYFTLNLIGATVQGPQGAPTGGCQPPQGTMMFFPGTQGEKGDKGDTGPQGPAGGSSASGIPLPTLASLRAVDATTFVLGAVVNLAGYWEAGDGGGGQFYYDPASVAIDNQGTIIMPTNGIGRWFRIFAGSVVSRWFGAKGDNSTDDTTPLQRWLTAAQGIN